MSAAEFRGWQVYFSQSPMREEAADWRMAIIVYTIRTLAGEKGLELKQCLPGWGPKRRPKPEEIMQAFKVFTALHGGKIVDGRDNR